MLLAILTLLGLLAVAGPCSSPDSPGPGRIFQPTDYASPSGAFVLHVGPGRPDGKGPAQCRMTRAGEVLWEQQLPVTFWEAAVTNEGVSIGYGYSEAKSGAATNAELHVMHLISVDIGGEVRFDRQTRRNWNASFGQLPVVRDFVVSPERDRVLLEVNESREVVEQHWWTYRLSDGKRLDDWQVPMPIEPTEGADLRLTEARALPSTDLILLQWLYWDSASSQHFTHYGSVYALLDGNDDVIWKLVRPLDFSVPGDKQASLALVMARQSYGTILSCEAQGRFALWFPSENTRADFTAQRDGESWSVELTKSSPLDLRLRTTWQAPAIDLPRLPSIALGGENTDEGEGQAERPLDPTRAAIDTRGQLLVLDASGDGAVFVYTADGSLANVLRPPQASGLRLSGPGATDERGVIHVPTIATPPGHRYHAHLRFAPHYGAVGELDLGDHRVRFDPRRPRYWRPAPGARELLCFGDAPRPVRTLAKRPDGRWWNGISDFALSADGATLAVLDTRLDRGGRRHAQLALFDADGERGAMVEIPDTDAVSVAVSSDWIALSDHHATVMLVCRGDDAPQRLATEPTEAFLTWGFSPDGKELWCVDVDAMTLHRFALPAD